MNRIFYRIHTEDRENLPALVVGYFDCFAVFRGVGYWCGKAEKAACIDIIATVGQRKRVQDLAARIRQENGQDAVYVSETATILRDIR